MCHLWPLPPTFFYYCHNLKPLVSALSLLLDYRSVLSNTIVLLPPQMLFFAHIFNCVFCFPNSFSLPITIFCSGYSFSSSYSTSIYQSCEFQRLWEEAQHNSLLLHPPTPPRSLCRLVQGKFGALWRGDSCFASFSHVAQADSLLPNAPVAFHFLLLKLQWGLPKCMRLGAQDGNPALLGWKCHLD